MNLTCAPETFFTHFPSSWLLGLGFVLGLLGAASALLGAQAVSWNATLPCALPLTVQAALAVQGVLVLSLLVSLLGLVQLHVEGATQRRTLTV